MHVAAHVVTVHHAARHPSIRGARHRRCPTAGLRALMPGKVVEVLIQVGDVVVRDQGLLVIEAMKMENEVKSPASGEVKEVLVEPGQAV